MTTVTYVPPAGVGITDDRAAHVARGSAEPGTDYATAYGTDLAAPGSGRVLSIDRSNDGAEGRRLTFLMDNGEVIDWIHLSQIDAYPGQLITAGQRGLARSGASGFGRDWYYDPHLHVTRRARIGLPYSQTLDFEDTLATIASAPGPITLEQEDDTMQTPIIAGRDTDGAIFSIPMGGKVWQYPDIETFNRHRNTLAVLEQNGWPVMVPPEAAKVVFVSQDKLNDLILAQGAWS
ncbi:M23 family metallopeptidase [Microbacterium sp. NPDC016588]